MRRRFLLALVAGVVVVAGAALLWPSPDKETGRILVDDARFPAALAPLDGGGLLYAERLTGRIRRVDAAGRLLDDPVASVEVSTDGQRGLLGLAVDDDGGVFAAWTRPDRRLVVGQVAPGAERVVWLGPETTDVANGGHIAFTSDGRLIIGIGDLLDPGLVTDPSAPNGKLLSLDPDGPADQGPGVVSDGWNNPFAFTFTSRDELWVADNSPGRRAERLARGDVDDPVITELDRRFAPSGLAAVGSRRLLLCGYVARTLQVYVIAPDGTVAPDGDPLATNCALGVALLADGRVVYSNEDEIRVLETRG